MDKRVEQIKDGFFIGLGIVSSYNLTIFVNDFFTILITGSK